MMDSRRAAAILLVCGLASGLRAQTVYSEIEPNDNKPQANGPFILSPGDTVVGNSLGSATSGGGEPASADYYLFKTAPMPLGIYRHRLLFSQVGAAGHFTQLRGLGQWDSVINGYPSFGGTADATVNFSVTTSTPQTPPRTLTWYGFGREERVYDRVTGGAATTGDYTLTYSRDQVAPVDLGVFQGGLLTITTAGQGHTSDTEIWVYDSDLRPIPGFNNDNFSVTPTPGATNSTLTRDVVAGGVYYIAISGQNITNNLASPIDDRMRSLTVHDFPDVVSCTNNTANLNCAFAITDGSGAVTQYPSGGTVNVTRAEPQDILWYKITVTAPSTGACCLPSGSCTIASQAGCAAAGGAYTAGANCGSVTCLQPPSGACCMPDSSCTQVSTFACTAAGGVWRGAATVCGACPRTLATIPAAAPSPLATQSGMFIDIVAGASDIQVTGIDYYTASGTHSSLSGPEGKLYVLPGASYLSATTGPDNLTPPAGWALNTDFAFPSNPGAWTPMHVALTTPVTIPAGQTAGFYIAARVHGIRIGGLLNAADPTSFANSDLTISSAHSHNGVATAYPYWATTVSSPRVFIGRVHYSVAGAPCYANCDGSTTVPILNVNDFICFQSKYAAQDPSANCDGSTTPPVLNVNDFICFQTAYAAGCR